MYYVYKHTNLKNGKVYIGITRQKPSRRWHGGNGYRDQPLFWNAIQKYGWDGFSHEILLQGLSETDAYAKEQEYIEQYKSTDREHGYNIAGGGIDSARFTTEYREKLREANKKRPPMSVETRLKISLSRQGRKMPPLTEEQRKKLSASLKGRTFSPEHCRKISESKRGKYTLADNPKAKRVRCIETGKVYACMKEVTNELGICNHNISSVCAGKLKTAGGFHWEYVKEV